MSSPPELSCTEIVGGNGCLDRRIDLPALEVWLYSRPAGGAEEGGDVVLVSLCGIGRVFKAYLADVAGHGRAVAPVARRLRDQVRIHLGDHDEISFFQNLNREAGDAGLDGSFATMAAVTFDLEPSRLVYAYAGHPHMLYRASGQPKFVPLLPGYCPLPGIHADLAIGVIPGTTYLQSAVPFLPGDMVVLFSDGFHESRVPGGGRLETDGFIDLLSSCSAEAVGEFRSDLTTRLADQTLVCDPDDDLSLVVIRRRE